jgi:hypothetical protein
LDPGTSNPINASALKRGADFTSSIDLNETAEASWPLHVQVLNGSNYTLNWIVDPLSYFDGDRILTISGGPAGDTVTDLDMTSNSSLPSTVTNSTGLTQEYVYTITLSTADPGIPGDVDGDGVVDGDDLAQVLQYLGTSDAAGDANLDGVVDIRDVVLVLQLLTGLP